MITAGRKLLAGGVIVLSFGMVHPLALKTAFSIGSLINSAGFPSITD
jgi:hypothetical protein